MERYLKTVQNCLEYSVSFHWAKSWGRPLQLEKLFESTNDFTFAVTLVSTSKWHFDCSLLPLARTLLCCFFSVSERMNVTIEPEPTRNSADFDPIFPDFTFFFFWVPRRLFNVCRASNGLQCYSEFPRDEARNVGLAMCSQSSQVVGHRALQSLKVEFSFHNEFNLFKFTKQAQLSKNSVSNFPEIVRLHRSAIDCLVLLNIFLRWSQKLIKSHFSFGQQKVSGMDAIESFLKRIESPDSLTEKEPTELKRPSLLIKKQT